MPLTGTSAYMCNESPEPARLALPRGHQWTETREGSSITQGPYHTAGECRGVLANWTPWLGSPPEITGSFHLCMSVAGIWGLRDTHILLQELLTTAMQQDRVRVLFQRGALAPENRRASHTAMHQPLKCLPGTTC